MAGTGITVVMFAVMIQIIFASKLMNVDSRQFPDKEARENPLKRNSDPYEHYGGCYDYHEYCDYWASIGECLKNPTYMYSTCQYSCDSCIYYKRDVTRNVGNSPPGTRDDSREQLRTDDKMKRAYELGQFIKKRQAWSNSPGNHGPPGTRETGSN